jgi:sirohydrochlorin cobaltochelatase
MCNSLPSGLSWFQAYLRQNAIWSKPVALIAHLGHREGVLPVPANAALLLVAHGSARYPDAAEVLHRHAAALRADGVFRRVEVGLLNGAPSVAEALARIDAAEVRVVPFFMEAGYFTREAIPRAIGGDRRARLYPPVGTHDGMAGLIERQALAACEAMGVPSRTAAILVAGHGSASAPGRTLALHEHAARVGWTTLFARVDSACLEEAPFVAGALRGLRHHPVVVIGFFAGDGGHVRDDVPALVAAERAARGQGGPGVRFNGSVTDDPTMVRIILDQAAV